MKKIILSSLTALSLLSTSAFADIQLDDSVYVGVYVGQTAQNASLLGSETEYESPSIELRAGWEKEETHRFSVFLNHQVTSEETLVNLKTDLDSWTLGVNYDFQIKNLDTGTGLFFGPSLFMVSASASQGSVSESAVGVGAGLRAGISQKITDSLDFEAYYQKDMISIDIEGVDMKERNKVMVGLSFKF